MWSKCSLAILLTMVLPPAAADCLKQGADPRFDPCPAADDVQLPMPGGLKMVFRKVEVPGGGFWADNRRIVQVGDPQGGVLQGPQKVLLGGTFQDPGADHWYYFLGKYEVSKAQVAAVLGNGDLEAGLDRLAAMTQRSDDKALAELPENKLAGDHRLALPASWLTWFEMQAFIDAYNIWCYADPACREALPGLRVPGGDPELTPGFLRLPTEPEWEYAARGGAAAANFADELPFERQQYKKFANLKENANGKLRPIGIREPVYGLHDLFGNVQELTAGLFQAEIGQGKAGALAARGGTSVTEYQQIRSAFRSEVGFYQVANGRMEASRSYFTGLRLAIASPVVPNETYRRQIEAEHQDYLARLRDQTPAGRSLVNPGVQATNTLSQSQTSLTNLASQFSQSPQVQRQIAEIEAQLRETSENLELRNQQVCDGYVKNAVIFSQFIVRSYREYQTKKRLADSLDRNQNKGAREQEMIFRLRRAHAHEQGNMTTYLRRYEAELGELAGCGERLAARSLAHFEELIRAGQVTLVEKESYSLLQEHFAELTRGGFNRNVWLDGIIEAFESKQLLDRL